MTDDTSVEEISLDAEDRMSKSVESMRGDMQRVRTGRASPALIEHIQIDFYGTNTPIHQAANVTVADARTLAIQPWDKTTVPAIEKAIIESDLGLNPVTAGDVIRIPLPPLTEERRKEMSKLVRGEGENGKVAVRNIRRDAIGKVKEMEKAKSVTKDEVKDFESDVQTMTDKFVGEIDKIVSAKEAEIMEV